MQAIQTTYRGPTNHNGSRIIAKCDAGRLTVAWDHSKDTEGNHKAAAITLARKLGWTTESGHGRLVSGSLSDGASYCHTFCRMLLKDGAEV